MLPLLTFLLLTAPLLAIDPAAKQKIGEQIWANECGKSKDKLTFWNAAEEFPSLGIGHFIWYPEGNRQRFEEIFPKLAAYLKKQGVNVPAWALGPCPWLSREAFYKDFARERLQMLRELLYETRALQVDFMVERMEQALAQFPLSNTLKQLKEQPRGVYALVDYINFKGLGLNPSERYNGEGWGLLQVLQAIPPNSSDVVQDFVLAAKKVLATRVKNSPPERNEARFLPGWNKRLETYLHF